jgi:hypothetical protein
MRQFAKSAVACRTAPLLSAARATTRHLVLPRRAFSVSVAAALAPPPCHLLAACHAADGNSMETAPETATPPRALGTATRAEHLAAAQTSLGPSCAHGREEKEKVWVADKRIPLESKMVI